MSGIPGQTSQLPREIPDHPRFGRRNLFRLLDGRSKIARLLRERRCTLTTGLGNAGIRPYEDDSLVDRFLSLEAVIQKMEIELASGQAIDLPSYLTALNVFLSMKRQLSNLRQAVTKERDAHPLTIEGENEGSQHG